MNMKDTAGFYRVTYDVIHKEFKIVPMPQVRFVGPVANLVECIDSGLKIYAVHITAKDITEGRKLGEILLKNHLGEDWQRGGGDCC
jgi:hypothetical protein